MKKVVDWFTRMRNRAYMYNVLLGATPLVMAYGIMEEEKWAGWVGLAGAVLGLVTARANVTTKE